MHACIQVFQHMNLRHLPVVDHLYRPVGIITRENLTATLLHRTAKAYLDKEDTSVSQPRYKNVYAAATEFVCTRRTPLSHSREAGSRHQITNQHKYIHLSYTHTHIRGYICKGIGRRHRMKATGRTESRQNRQEPSARALHTA